MYKQLVRDLFMKMNLQKWLKLLWEIEVERKVRKTHRNSVVRYKKIWNLVITDNYCNDAKTYKE